MQAVSYSNLRQNLAAFLDKVTSSSVPILITREKKSAVMLMSLEEYESIMETFYLLKSPKNAEQLLRAVEDFNNNKNFKAVVIE